MVSAGAAARRGSSTLARLALFLVISVVSGLLLAGLALPIVGSLGLVARESANTFQPDNLPTPPLAQSSRMLAADGSLITTFYDQDRVDVPLSRVAPVMRQAIVAIEDARFYQHGGIDLRGTLRAAMVNRNGDGGQTQGGSSLTQQYVKNVLLQSAIARGDTDAIHQATVADGVQGYSRKLHELQYAIALEDRLTKDQILERYLNIAGFGGQIYGIEAASRHYFSKHASQLTLPEAAYLAGLVRNPSGYDILRTLKTRHAQQVLMEDAVNRRDTVINRMRDLGIITATQATAAKAVTLKAKPSRPPNGCANATVGGYFCDYVTKLILTNPIYGKTEKDRENLLIRGGITIRTSLVPRVQRSTDAALAKHIKATDAPVGSVVVMAPGTGKIEAMSVSRPYGTDLKKHENQINLAVDARYGGTGAQAGSTFKAFTAVAALEQGYGFHYKIHSPAELRDVEATSCNGSVAKRKDWSPANESGNETGTYDMLRAMAKSINTYWVQMEEHTGICRPATVARRMGVHWAEFPSKPIPDTDLAFTIGVHEASPLDMAKAYATFANRGVACQELPITGVTLRGGKQLHLPGARCAKVMEPEIADAVNYILKGVVQNGTGSPANIGRPQAGKTGTSEGYTAWFVGYTPDLATAVGVWDPRGRQPRYDLRDITIGGEHYSRVHGMDLPAPIWRDVMTPALTGVKARDFVPPLARFFEGTQGPGVEPPAPTQSASPPAGPAFTPPAFTFSPSPAPAPSPSHTPSVTPQPTPSHPTPRPSCSNPKKCPPPPGA